MATFSFSAFHLLTTFLVVRSGSSLSKHFLEVNCFAHVVRRAIEEQFEQEELAQEEVVNHVNMLA